MALCSGTAAAEEGGKAAAWPGSARTPDTQELIWDCFCAAGDPTIRYISLAGLSAELYYSYSGFKL